MVDAGRSNNILRKIITGKRLMKEDMIMYYTYNKLLICSVLLPITILFHPYYIFIGNKHFINQIIEYFYTLIASIILMIIFYFRPPRNQQAVILHIW